MASDDARTDDATLPVNGNDGSTVSLASSMTRATAVGETPPTIPGYTIERLIGHGGMGEVWLATHGTLQRMVALKVLRKELTQDADFVERFLREARSAARLNHPGVVVVHDAGQVDGCLYMAMEYVSGGDLRDRLSLGKPMPLAEVCKLILTVADSLQAIHDAGLIHRDLKPENLLLDGQGHIKIADLGLARAEQGDDRMTTTGQAMGTPAYMSPEQAQGITDVDGRSDIYALGATMFAMLTGRPPFTGATPWVVVSQVMNAPPPDVREFTASIPSAVAELIAKTLAKDRTQRPASARAFADALRAALAQPSTSSAQPKAPASPSSPMKVKITFPAWRPAPRVLWIGGAVLAAVLLLIILIANDDGSGSAEIKSSTTSSKPNTTESSNPLHAIRDGFRGVRKSIVGSVEEKLDHPVSYVARAVRSALGGQGLTITHDSSDDDSAKIEAKLPDGETLTVALSTSDKQTYIRVKIGALGDEKRSKIVMEWIHEEL